MAENSKLEIERKFLITEKLPDDLEEFRQERLDQGYLALADDGTEVRVRRVDQNDSKYWLTVKSGTGKTRTETEVEITQEQFEQLWPATSDQRLEKIRYYVAYSGLTIELDVYLGQLSGLIVAEVEFQSEEASLQFEPPKWFGMEVTEDGGFKNKNLAKQGRLKLVPR